MELCRRRSARQKALRTDLYTADEAVFRITGSISCSHEKETVAHER